MPYHSIDEILRRCRDRACPFWQVVLTTQAKETQLPPGWRNITKKAIPCLETTCPL